MDDTARFKKGYWRSCPRHLRYGDFALVLENPYRLQCIHGAHILFVR